MKITEITASAGRTFNHPHEEYSNLKPHVTLKATLEEGEDPAAVAKSLQQLAEQLVEDQKQGMLKALEDAYEMGEKKARMIGLARQLKAAQEEMDEIRRAWPQASQLALDGSASD